MFSFTIYSLGKGLQEIPLRTGGDECMGKCFRDGIYLLCESVKDPKTGKERRNPNGKWYRFIPHTKKQALKKPAQS